jgi:toxin ParE1/3/4
MTAKRYVLSPGAAEELERAVEFYRSQASFATANALLEEFARAVMLLLEQPGIGTKTSRGRRLLPLRRFPFSLLYRLEGDELRISAVAHHSRRPGYWRGRS